MKEIWREKRKKLKQNGRIHYISFTFHFNDLSERDHHHTTSLKQSETKKWSRSHPRGGRERCQAPRTRSLPPGRV
jgi:hypothetical protein